MVESGCSCRFNRQPLDIIRQYKFYDDFISPLVLLL
jgi:hypothetical protein